MPHAWRKLRARTAGVTAVLLAALAASAAASASVPLTDQRAPAVAPPRKAGVPLSSSVLRAVVRRGPALRADGRRGRAPRADGLASSGGVVVEVLFRRGDGAAARAAIAKAGGDPRATIPGELIEARVPITGLVAVESDPTVRYLRPPLDYSEPADGGVAKLRRPTALRLGPNLGEQVEKTNAAAWHAAGIAGRGVKVGIIDSFRGSAYNAAVDAGEIPAASGTFCRWGGSNCAASVFDGDRHGVAVAEAVADMAPAAKLYLATAMTAADTQAALDYFRSQGVEIVTRSQTGRYDGPGNGTGPIASVIEGSAVGQGMFYLNAAGNGAGRNGTFGSYWRGPWVDGNSNGFIEFAPGDELMGFDCAYINGLRWSDWGQGSGTTDYDLYLLDDETTPTVIASSEDSQGSSGGSAPPLEHIDSYPCPDSGVAYMAIRRYAPGSGSAGDVLEIMTNGGDVEHFQNPFSASGPMADLDSPGAVAVGAVDPALGTTIANYSSEGPTNDNRIKPDLSAAACVKSLTYSPGCFNGTSSATPVTAGAAALVLSAGAAGSPQDLKAYLLNATVDRGAPGADNVYGRGELRLPSPPQGDRSPPDVEALASAGRSGRFARLRYRVSDDSGESRERIQVIRRGSPIADVTTGFGPAAGGVRYVRWSVPKRIRGKMRFCVVSRDRAGNASTPSCAGLEVKRKRRRR